MTTKRLEEDASDADRPTAGEAAWTGEPGWREEQPRSEGSLAEGALVLLMAGMIVFAIFSMAPRPEPSPSARDAQPAAPQAAVEEAGVPSSPSPVGVTLPLTQTPVSASTPVPPTRTPARAAQPTPTAATGKTYVVRAGDTLFSVARANHVTVESLSKANGLSDPARLRVGQTLKIP